MILRLLFILGLLHAISGLHVAPTDERVLRSGRMLKSADGKCVTFDWSNVSFSIRFKGTSAFAIIQEASPNRFAVFVDGIQTKMMMTYSNTTKYTLTEKLNDSIHVVTLTRVTEPILKASTLCGFDIESASTPTILDPPVRPSRKIEFLGDSVTAGYGLDGTPPCPFTAETENSLKAFSGFAARALGAEMTAVAWSGIGMVRNYGYKDPISPDAFPYHFPHTLGSNATSLWDFNMYKPDLVVLNVGSNDFSTKPSPTYEQFSSGYHSFLSYLRKQYTHQPHIVCTCQHDFYCPTIERIVKEELSDGYTDLSFVNMSEEVYFDFKTDVGCAGHPNERGAAKMGLVMLDHIRSVMNW